MLSSLYVCMRLYLSLSLVCLWFYKIRTKCVYIYRERILEGLLPNADSVNFQFIGLGKIYFEISYLILF